MTEQNSKTKTPKNESQESTVELTQATPGQQLKEGRKAKGLSEQQVADRLHLRLGDIIDIESDTHRPGVSITFTKGYVRIYAKLLSMPVDPLLESFDILHQGDKQPAKLQSFSQRVAKQAHDDRWMMVTYFIAFLVVASLVIWWYQQSDKSIMNRLNLFTENTTEQQSNNASFEEGEPVNIIVEKQLMPDELAISEEFVKQQNTNEAELKSLETNQGQLTQSKLATAADSETDNPFTQQTALEEEGAAEAKSAAIASNIKDAYTLNDDGTADLTFTFNEDCWLSVTDVNGEVIAVGTKVKGRVMSVNGVPPISVNLCPPDNVTINFAGAPVDLSSYPSGIPVKFELAVTGA
jgi:cytoskeleton protein RodZ